MRKLILAFLLFPLVSTAQYENHPDQQALWDYMKVTAPTYMILTACERDYTADLLYTDLMGLAAMIVLDRRDAAIVLEMWEQAQAQAALEYQSQLAGAGQDPDSEACDTLENSIIEMLDAGV